MEILRTDFIKAIKFLKPAIGKNDSRPNLMYLSVETQGQRLTMTAADAFCIKRVVFGDQAKGRKTKFLIDQETLDCFVKICNTHKSRHYPYETFTIKKGSLVSKTVKVVFEQPSYEFPNLERLINTEYKEQTGEILIGIGLTNIGNCLKGFPNDGRHVVKFQSNGPESPLKITSLDGVYTAICLPVRIQW